MTANSSEELVRHFNAGLDALERHDIEGFMAELEASLDPDIEFVSIIGSAVEGSPYLGPDGVKQWFNNLLGTTEHVRWTDRQTRVLDDRTILFLATFEIQGAASGAKVTTEVGTVFEIEEGRVRRAQTYGSHRDAAAAAESLVGHSA